MKRKTSDINAIKHGTTDIQKVYQGNTEIWSLVSPLDGIPTNGLVLYIDAFYEACYPGSGTTIYDLSGNGNNGSLMNGAGFNSGVKSFTVNNENSDEYINIPTTSSLDFRVGDDFTLMAYSTADFVNTGRVSFFGRGSGLGSYGMSYDDMTYSYDPLELFAGSRANNGSIGYGYDFSGSYDFSGTNNTATYRYEASNTVHNLYENGNHLETETIDLNDAYTFTGDYTMGKKVAIPNGGSGYIENGQFYACLVYNRILTYTEINNIDAHLKSLR